MTALPRARCAVLRLCLTITNTITPPSHRHHHQTLPKTVTDATVVASNEIMFVYSHNGAYDNSIRERGPLRSLACTLVAIHFCALLLLLLLLNEAGAMRRTAFRRSIRVRSSVIWQRASGRTYYANSYTWAG